MTLIAKYHLTDGEPMGYPDGYLVSSLENLELHIKISRWLGESFYIEWL